jgi:hypothetical protein
MNQSLHVFTMGIFRAMRFLLVLSLVGRALGNPAATTMEVYVDGAKSPRFGPDITVPQFATTFQAIT